MKKRYWLRFGIVGAIIALIIILYGLTQIGCVGLYLNPDGTTGTVCPTSLPVIFLENVTMMPAIAYLYLIGIILVAFVVFSIIGWVYGKIINRNKTIAQ